jgi:hypothetical protein
MQANQVFVLDFTIQYYRDLLVAHNAIFFVVLGECLERQMSRLVTAANFRAQYVFMQGSNHLCRVAK